MSLELFSERNPWLSDPLIPARKYRKLLMENQYLLIYQMKGSTVYIDAVVDTCQDYGWLLQTIFILGTSFGQTFYLLHHKKV